MMLDQRYVCEVEGVIEQFVFEDIHPSHACDQPRISEYFPGVKKASTAGCPYCVCVCITCVGTYIRTDR